MLSLFFLLLHLYCFFLSSSMLFSISFSFLLFLPVALLLLLYVFSSSLFLFIRVFLLLSKVSWCSWLSHHFYVVRVPGSNPGGTIFTCYILLLFTFYPPRPSRLPFSYRIIGRFISSRIHPFPSEHGSKDA